MKKNGLRCGAFGFVSCIALASFGRAATIQLITNGGFETGDFTGWSANTEAGSDGTLSVSSSTIAPNSDSSTAGPASGTYYALTDQTGPGAYALTQSFTVTPGATSVMVSFDLFANDYAGAVDTGPLDYTGGSIEFATADLLTGTANPFSTAPGDILENFYQGADNLDNNPNPYTAYSFDITSLVSGGGTFQIRFGEADNLDFFDLGVDNVSVTEQIQGTPEPATFLLIGPTLFGLAAFRLRQLAAWRKEKRVRQPAP